MKRLLLTLSSILLCTQMFASHIAGGDIRYEYNGTNYTVYLTLFGDCNISSVPFASASSVNFQSASTSANFNRVFNLTSTNQPDLSCYSGPCSPSAVLPGYTIVTYSDTVTLPPASDWIISFPPGSARNNHVNVLSSQNTIIYIETTLNNSSSVNSNPRLAAWPTVFIAANQPIYFPLSALDLDGDSIAYEFIDPLQDPTTPVQYNPGYSSASPLGSGSTLQINASANNIKLQGNLLGSHALALKIKEYRNNSLIASYIREFSVSPISGFVGQQTIPTAASSSVFDIYTCPGQNNAITISFVDSIATDSVYVTAQPPVMSGWSFNTNSSAAPGVGSTTITWTTPASVNPATLKQFAIKVTARDNTCPIRSMVDHYVTVRLQQCSADSVWPGDANDDNTVNLYDPLNIAIAYAQTGSPRPGASTSWTAQYCAPWNGSFPTNNANMKHSDCDGNGVINSSDLLPIATNYGQFHLKGNGEHEKTTGAPELYFDLTGVVLLPGANASIPVRVGNAISPVNNLYGLATRIKIEGLNFTASPTVATGNSWLGVTALNFTYPVSTSTVDWAHARIDQQEVSGDGIAGMLNFTVPTSATQGQTVKLSFELPKLINKDGHDITFNAINTSLKVGFPDHVNEISDTMNALVVPNPSGNSASLYLNTKQSGDVRILIVNVMGQQVWQQQYLVSAGNHNVTLPSGIAPGLYSVHINGPSSSHTIKWIKQQ